MTAAAPAFAAWLASEAAISVPASLTLAITGTRPLMWPMANSSKASRSPTVRLTDLPACIGSAKLSAPLRR